MLNKKELVMKTFIITFICADNSQVKIVAKATGIKRAIKVATPLFYKVAQYRCVKKLTQCLG
jgi:hypothetical protein